MKTYASLILILVLTAALLVGCGCTNKNKVGMSDPTVLPTNEELWESTAPTTRATTAPTAPSETHDRGNGPLEDMIPGSTDVTGATGNTEATEAAEGRSRGMMPGSK